MATLTEVFAAIDKLPERTTAERALHEFKAALTTLANADQMRSAEINVRFGSQTTGEMDVSTRLNIPLRRKSKIS